MTFRGEAAAKDSVAAIAAADRLQLPASRSTGANVVIERFPTARGACRTYLMAETATLKN